jgi:hypothetical protein
MKGRPGAGIALALLALFAPGLAWAQKSPEPAIKVLTDQDRLSKEQY